MKYRWTLAEDFVLDVEPIEFELLSEFRIRATAAGLAFRPTNNCLWLAGRIDDEIVSFAGLKRMGRRMGKTRLKAAYTLPEWRGLGIGSAMAETRLDWSLLRGLELIEVYTENPSFFLLRGFEPFSRTGYRRTLEGPPIVLCDQPQARPFLLEKETSSPPGSTLWNTP